MSVAVARSRAASVIASQGVKSPPVDVEAVAAALGLTLVRENLGDGVSGLLVSNRGAAFVCVQETDHPNRQRFTIAHEIGHFVLRHQFVDGEHVHVDRGNFISQRGPRSATGVDPKEIEANQFAACLLLPDDLVQDEVAACGGSPLLDCQVSDLAAQFEVSEQAMTIRLSTLGLL